MDFHPQLVSHIHRFLSISPIFGRQNRATRPSTTTKVDKKFSQGGLINNPMNNSIGLLKQSLVAALAAVIGLSSLSLTTIARADNNNDNEVVAVNLQNHLSAGYPLQDVFLQSSTNAEQVVRADVGAQNDANLQGAMLFASNSAIAHDYFKLGAAPLGPFAKGRQLQITFSDWLAANGAGTVVNDNDRTNIDLSFNKLVPFGVYSVWCNRVTYPPALAMSLQPCGSLGGANNTFIANDVGEARYTANVQRFAGTSGNSAMMISVVYHSDRETHGERPGEWGLYSHEQLVAFIPQKPAPNPPVPASSCMQQVITSRENALVGAVQTYTTRVTNALDVRRSALVAAWGLTNSRDRNKMINDAQKAFRKSRNDARKDYNRAWHDIMKKYRADRAECKPPASIRVDEEVVI